MKMQIYTNDTSLVSTIQNGNSLYFGFDFNINNTDVSLADFKADIVLCKFNIKNVKCYDYAYDYRRKVYLDNSGPKVVKSNKNIT